MSVARISAKWSIPVVTTVALVRGPQAGAPGVVGVQYRQAVAVAGQVFQRRAFLAGHAGLVAEELDMGEADVGDHPDIGADQLGEDAHLARVIRAELEHAEVVAAFEAEQAQRHADVVVLVGRGLGEMERSPSTAAIISLVVVFRWRR